MALISPVEFEWSDEGIDTDVEVSYSGSTPQSVTVTAPHYKFDERDVRIHFDVKFDAESQTASLSSLHTSTDHVSGGISSINEGRLRYYMECIVEAAHAVEQLPFVDAVDATIRTDE